MTENIGAIFVQETNGPSGKAKTAFDWGDSDTVSLIYDEIVRARSLESFGRMFTEQFERYKKSYESSSESHIELPTAMAWSMMYLSKALFNQNTQESSRFCEDCVRCMRKFHLAQENQEINWTFFANWINLHADQYDDTVMHMDIFDSFMRAFPEYDINKVCRNGLSFLMVAISSRTMAADYIPMLVDRGADLYQAHPDFGRPEHFLSKTSTKSIEKLQLLMDKYQVDPYEPYVYTPHSEFVSRRISQPDIAPSDLTFSSLKHFIESNLEAEIAITRKVKRGLLSVLLNDKLNDNLVKNQDIVIARTRKRSAI